MLLYELFKVLDERFCRCTVIAETTKVEKTILEDGVLSDVDNKAMYYIVDRIDIINRHLSSPLVKIYVIAR